MVECCDWSGGKPNLGRMQEAARDMRWVLFSVFLNSSDCVSFGPDMCHDEIL